MLCILCVSRGGVDCPVSSSDSGARVCRYGGAASNIIFTPFPNLRAVSTPYCSGWASLPLVVGCLVCRPRSRISCSLTRCPWPLRQVAPCAQAPGVLCVTHGGVGCPFSCFINGGAQSCGYAAPLPIQCSHPFLQLPFTLHSLLLELGILTLGCGLLSVPP